MVKDKIWKISTVSAIILLMASLGVNVSDVLEDDGYLPYSCSKADVPDMLCYKLSRVNDNGIQRNCYYDRDRPAKYKVCSTGWSMLPPDQNMNCPVVIAYTDEGKFYCNRDGDCVDESLSPHSLP